MKRALAKTAPGAAAGGAGIPEIPAQDFAKFGTIETKALSRMKRLSGPHLHRAWLNIPHVTHTDEADITDLEAYRKTLDSAAKAKGFRVTLLVFLMKASVVALKEFPEFNASLSPDKGSLILKKYYNIGVAVDTPDGLVVPVIKDVDRKGVLELSQELSAVSAKMRDGKIAPVGYTGRHVLDFLSGRHRRHGLHAHRQRARGRDPRRRSRGHQAQVGRNDVRAAAICCPLCLSYDHRVIDGALAARFTRRLADVLEDVRQLVL